ncbi:MAG: ABC transporter permease [Gammaproteobacteria bacterium]|nr:ABC transporter permease [Gammaproteobacteria bacterium]
MLVVFWTDALIFLLLISIAAAWFFTRQSRHLRSQWRNVILKPAGMASLMILMLYVIVGLMDSMHFRQQVGLDAAGNPSYGHEVLSVFDLVVTPLRIKEEKSYSAPFATTLYVKETMETSGATNSRIFPRLLHGGKHLNNPENDKTADIVKTSFYAVLISSGLWLVCLLLTVFFLAKNTATTKRMVLTDIVWGKRDMPWRTVFLVLYVLMTFVVLMTLLSKNYHVFGTDKVGQDVFYQTLKSIRTGLVIGSLTTLVMLPFALLFGIMAGYFRGWIDDVIQYLYTTLNSIPGVLLIAASVLMLDVYIANHEELFQSVEVRADMRLLFLCLILGVTSWTGLCRLLRGESLKLRELEYVQAAKAFGVAEFTILRRHILPNVMHIVLISIALDFSGLVLAEAILSYVGVGVDPTMNSWGNMINGARLEMAREPIVWWSLAAAFFFMFVLVLAANVFADAVRDAFDPRLRHYQ